MAGSEYAALIAMSTVRHPYFARYYARLSLRMEPEIGRYRRRLLAGLRGRVIEIGAGNGLNFGHYPPAVDQVYAVEPEPRLRALAVARADEVDAEVEVVDGVADELPADDASFDAAVLSLVLCSVPDQATALAEVRRVLRPDGELRFFEHVRADTAGLRRVQRALDATIYPRLAGGCHLNRDTAAAIEEAGFAVESIEPLRVPDTRISLPATPHILGIARPS
ncbi:MAG TPA: class I SAM-dependent methyltransferase [Nocardioidaceae bacterium]|nr:class I SAM-dependent methyltransferase [Nocardioidaceae bacterium]